MFSLLHEEQRRTNKRKPIQGLKKIFMQTQVYSDQNSNSSDFVDDNQVEGGDVILL